MDGINTFLFLEKVSVIHSHQLLSYPFKAKEFSNGLEQKYQFKQEKPACDCWSKPAASQIQCSIIGWQSPRQLEGQLEGHCRSDPNTWCVIPEAQMENVMWLLWFYFNQLIDVETQKIGSSSYADGQFLETAVKVSGSPPVDVIWTVFWTSMVQQNHNGFMGHWW